MQDLGRKGFFFSLLSKETNLETAKRVLIETSKKKRKSMEQIEDGSRSQKLSLDSKLEGS